MLKGSAESWRGCHNSGRESSVMPAARLVQMASATRDPRVILWGNSSRCLSYVTAQQGEAEAGGTRRGAHVRGICAFIKCGCVHSLWFIWDRLQAHCGVSICLCVFLCVFKLRRYQNIHGVPYQPYCVHSWEMKIPTRLEPVTGLSRRMWGAHGHGKG